MHSKRMRTTPCGRCVCVCVCVCRGVLQLRLRAVTVTSVAIMGVWYRAVCVHTPAQVHVRISTLDRMNDTRLWKHYLPVTSFVGGNMSIKYNNLCLQEQDYYRFLYLCSKNFYRSHHTNQFEYLAQKTQQNHATETNIITMLGIVSTSLASHGTLY